LIWDFRFKFSDLYRVAKLLENELSAKVEESCFWL